MALRLKKEKQAFKSWPRQKTRYQMINGLVIKLNRGLMQRPYWLAFQVRKHFIEWGFGVNNRGAPVRQPIPGKKIFFFFYQHQDSCLFRE